MHLEGGREINCIAASLGDIHVIFSILNHLCRTVIIIDRICSMIPTSAAGPSTYTCQISSRCNDFPMRGTFIPSYSGGISLPVEACGSDASYYVYSVSIRGQRFLIYHCIRSATFVSTVNRISLALDISSFSGPILPRRLQPNPGDSLLKEIQTFRLLQIARSY